MQDQDDIIHRLWAISDLAKIAVEQCQIICQRNNAGSDNAVLEVMSILKDATEKLSHMRWTDPTGINHGTRIYTQAIKNL